MPERETKPALTLCRPGPDTHCGAEFYPLCADVRERAEEEVFAEDKLVSAPTPDGEFETFFVRDGAKMPAGARAPRDSDDPETPGNQSEVDRAFYTGLIRGHRYDGICRKVEKGRRGEEINNYYAWVGLTSFLTFHNVDQGRCVMIDKAFVELSVAEMRFLVPLLKLSNTDMTIHPGYAPKLQSNGAFSMGRYQFTNNVTRIKQMKHQLANAPFHVQAFLRMAGTHKKLNTHFDRILEAYDTQMGAIDSQVKAMNFGYIVGAGSLLLTGILLYIFKKNLGISRDMREMMRENMDFNRKIVSGETDKNRIENFTSDLVDAERGRLAADVVSNEIRGRDAEALEFLRRLSRPRYANPMLIGESGVGKDKIVERAAQLIALNDPRVPEQFRNGTIKGILIVDPSAFSANTNIRGDAAARANALIKAMIQGWAVYFPEIADFLSSGVARDGASESLASQLKDALTRGARFAGSTTPGSFSSLVRQIPWLRDIERRMPPMEVKDLHLDVIRDLVPKSMAPYYQDYYDVGFEEGVIDKAINVALKNMPEGSHARIDAIDQLLMDSIERAAVERRANGERLVLTEMDIFKEIAERTGKSISTVEMESRSFEETVPPKSAEHMAMERSFAKSLGERLVVERWYSHLDEAGRHEAVRAAGSLLLGEGGDRFRGPDGGIKWNRLAPEVERSILASAASAQLEAAAPGAVPPAVGAAQQAPAPVLSAHEVQPNDIIRALDGSSLEQFRTLSDRVRMDIAVRMSNHLNGMPYRDVQGYFTTTETGAPVLDPRLIAGLYVTATDAVSPVLGCRGVRNANWHRGLGDGERGVLAAARRQVKEGQRQVRSGQNPNMLRGGGR